ncbi:hypothetical protein [Streptomyces fagopyri]|uniref:hypothetical protein n=1 Tax=Streptomyces fagopyri TaxID=2662397 RepID=UPI0037FB8948
MRTLPRPPALFVPPGLAIRCPDHAQPGFRVLVCDAHPDRTACRRAWVGHNPAQVYVAQRLRFVHRVACAGGVYAAAGL